MDKLADITAQGWILAYFIRSDGERFLLGTGAYDFKSDLQHFQPNTMANDIVELQGTDGQLIAGQVRRSATQSFNGYVGDSTQNRERIEELRRDFLMFFRKNFFYKTVYIYPNGTAIQRKRGYLVDAPSVPELYQLFPEYHVALNYEDPNYYEYAEDAYGDEIFANILAITLTTPSAGGLVWDAIGAVSHGYVWSNPQTASGSAFQITGIEGAPLTLTEITGNATQNGTPTPDAPIAVNTTTGENVVKITGKNLISSYVKNGNSVLFNGSTGYEDYIFKAGTYTLSYQDTNTCTTYMKTASSSNTSIGSGKTITFTATEPFNIWLYRSGITTEEISNLQLELGSTATDYEPYQGQEYEVNLGKNLSTVSHKDNVQWSDGDVGIKNILNSLPVGHYVVSMDFTLTQRNSTSDASTYGLYIPNSGGNIQKNNVAWGTAGVGDTKSFELAIDITEARKGNFTNFQFYGCGITGTGATGKANVTNIQLELGSTATSFAPYFTPIELAKIGDYQDRIYKDSGKWYIEKQTGKVVLNGSETWAYYSSYGGFRYRNDDFNVSSNNPSEDLICSHFTVATVRGASPTAPVIKAYTLNTDSTYIFLCDGTSDVDAFKQWLSTHPTTVYYALATPTTTEITDSTLLAQLNFIANLYGGTNNIMLVGTGAQGEIEVQYMTEVDTDGAGYEWEGGGGGGNTITLDAVEAVRPVWQVVGPATNPTLTNITTGETISFDGTVPAGQTLTVDMDARTATMAGANVFQFITGDWLRLEPGNNRISYTATGTTEPSTLSWNGVVG